MLKLGIWSLMIVTVVTVHQVREVQVRQYADQVVHGIEAFHQNQGRYPTSLEEAGFKTTELKDKLAMPHYSCKPMFYYPDTVMIFHMWRYDFDKRVWVEEYD